MATMTLKRLRENVENTLAEGIVNKEQLIRALPALVALQDALKFAKKHYDETKAIAAQLSDACAKYASEHHDYVFGESFLITPTGAETGDVAIDGRTYHYSRGYDGYMRDSSAETMSQAFLSGLPPEWIRTKMEIDSTAVRKLGVTEATLAEYGLRRKPKIIWHEDD